MMTVTIVIQKKVPRQSEESIMARITVIMNSIISIDKLHTILFVKLPLKKKIFVVFFCLHGYQYF